MQTLITNTITIQNKTKNTENSDTPHAMQTTQLITIDTAPTAPIRKTTEKEQTPIVTTTQTHTDREEAPPQDDRWGHSITPKATGYVRFLAQNIGGIDLTTSGSIKLAALREFTISALVDMVAIKECNAAWDNVYAKLHPVEQTQYWWECSQWSIGHN